MIRVVLAILCICLSTACDKAPPPSTAPDEAPQWVKEAQERSLAKEEAPAEPEVEQLLEKPLLWRVKPSNGAAESTLLGTYHVGTDFKGLPALPKSVRTAFEASSTLVLETDTGTPDLEEAREFLVLPKGKSLQSMMKPDVWDILLEESGLPPQKAQRLRPHVVVGEITTKWTPNPGVRGMDARFVILGRAHDKERRFLETPIEQFRTLANMVTVDILVEMLEDVPGQKAQMEALRLAYLAGDAETLERLTFDPQQMKSHPGFHEALFWKRNRQWVPILKPLLDAGGVFVAVGAGHLVGDDSLVTLLQAEGYVVERVEP